MNYQLVKEINMNKLDIIKVVAEETVVESTEEVVAQEETQE